MITHLFISNRNIIIRLLNVTVLCALVTTIRSLSPFLEIEQDNWYSIYALAKIGIIAYYMLLIYSLGDLILGKLKITLNENYLSEIILKIILGNLIIYFVYFVLALCGLINYLIFILILLLFSLSINLKDIFNKINIIKKGNYDNNTKIILIISSVYVYMVWVVCCQNPADGDFLTHYAQYYLKIVKSGNVAPNEVWYHYFYSKGNITAILFITLLDISGILISSYIYFIFSIFLLVEIVKYLTNEYFWGLLSVCVFCSLLLIEYQGGHFEKHHIANLFNIALIIYSLIKINKYDGKNIIYNLMLTCAIILTTITSLSASLYVAIILAYSVAKSLLTKNKNLVIISFINLLFLIIIIVISFLINYFLTGFYEITPFKTFSIIGDYQKVSEWVSPYLISYLIQGSEGDMGKFTINFDSVFETIYSILRIKNLLIAFPIYLLIPSLILLLIHIFKNNLFNKKIVYPLELIVIALLAAILSGIAVSQPVSVLRATIFVSYYLAMLSGISSAYMLHYIYKIKDNKIYLMVFCNSIFIFLITNILFNLINSKFIEPQKNILSLSSIDKFYEMKAWPEYNAVGVNIRKLLGPSEKIIFMPMPSNRLGRGWVLGDGVISEMSYSLGPKWHDIVFSTADVQKKLLKDQGINFFIIKLDDIGIGGLPHSDLFKRNNLNKYFKIIYRENNLLVLTWDDDNIGKKLSSNDLNKWENNLKKDQSYNVLYQNVYQTFLSNNKNTMLLPQIPENLPKAKGWQ